VRLRGAKRGDNLILVWPSSPGFSLSWLAATSSVANDVLAFSLPRFRGLRKPKRGPASRSPHDLRLLATINQQRRWTANLVWQKTRESRANLGRVMAQSNFEDLQVQALEPSIYQDPTPYPRFAFHQQQTRRSAYDDSDCSFSSLLLACDSFSLTSPCRTRTWSMLLKMPMPLPGHWNMSMSHANGTSLVTKGPP
jgi:hypothetical protein